MGKTSGGHDSWLNAIVEEQDTESDKPMGEATNGKLDPDGTHNQHSQKWPAGVLFSCSSTIRTAQICPVVFVGAMGVSFLSFSPKRGGGPLGK